MKTLKTLSLSLALLCLASVAAFGQNRTRFAGFYSAGDYAYGVNSAVAPLRVDIGNSATGTQTITLAFGNITLADGTVVMPLSTNAKITVGVGSNAETVTPTAVSCATPNQYDTCTVTADFSNTHGVGDLVSSGTYGLAEAIDAANGAGGGTVLTDSQWITLGGSKSTITGITSATPKVWVLDLSGTAPTWYGKSGTGAAAYSDSNNDMVFTVTLASGAGSKTLSQTYATAPVCVGTDQTAADAVKVTPSTTAVAVAGTSTDVIAVSCPGLVK